MKRYMAVLVALGCGSILACAAAKPNGPYGGDSMRPGSKRRIDIEVGADLSVSPDPVHLSKAGNHQAHWTLKAGSGPIHIEPEESEAEWPLDVTCDTPTHCVGKIKANGKVGSHPYRVAIGDRTGPDPVIIIEP
jgi:hypothetical protein